MFQDACRMYGACFCTFGGGTASTQGKLHSASCLLSPNYAITARHCVTHALAKYSWPVISTYRGLFKCEPLQEWGPEDIAVVRLTDRVAGASHESPRVWPQFGGVLTLGMTVGYMSRLWKPGHDGDIKVFTFFASAHVSFFAKDDSGGPRYVLSGGFTQSGFSGSPVFDSAGILLAIATNAFMMNSIVDGETAAPFVLPQVSPMPSMGADLLRLIEQDRH